MSADPRYRGPSQRPSTIHPLGVHAVHQWGVLRPPGPSHGDFRLPLPAGPRAPPPGSPGLRPPLQCCYENTPVPLPPMLHYLAQQPGLQQPFRPQPPVNQPHPPLASRYPPPNIPLPANFPLLDGPVKLQMPAIPLKILLSPQHSIRLPVQQSTSLQFIHPDLPHHAIMEPKPPGLDTPGPPSGSPLQIPQFIPDPSNSLLSRFPREKLTSFSESESSKAEQREKEKQTSRRSRLQIEQFIPDPSNSLLSRFPHENFTGFPESEPSKAEQREKENQTFRSINHSTFSPNVLDDSDDEQDNKPSTYLFLPETIDYTYRPPLDIDPFANSRSLRHQQPANPRRKKVDDDETEHHDDDSEVDEDLDEDFAVRGERAYQEMLPRVKSIITELGIDETWQSDKEEKTCMVCPFPQRLKGWTALLQHTDQFKKRRPVQHRAYYRALTELLKQAPRRADDERSEEKAILLDNGKFAEERIVWPPLVIITNLRENETLDQYVPNLANLDIENILRERNSSKPGRMLVIFPPSEIGHLNAKLLVESLAKLVIPHMHIPNLPFNRMAVTAPSSGGYAALRNICPFQNPVDPPQLPVGHLAEPVDMVGIDPHKKLISWSEENKRQILKSVSKKSKEEHEREKARVKAKLVEVDKIAESYQKFKSSKALLSQQLKDAEIALEEQKRLEEYISYKHAEQLQFMDARFKDELSRLEMERLVREGKIRAQLVSSAKQLEKERVERSKEVEILKSHFATITKELEKQKAQKALKKERDITSKREQILAEIQQREAQFNTEARNTEKNLLEKHEAEKFKLVEDFHRMRQDILMEWLEKQAALKAAADKAKKERELLEREAKNISMEGIKECSVCFTEFGEEVKRALIQPCGHAKICVQCAVDIYHKTKLCPICRKKISTKPKLMPRLYM